MMKIFLFTCMALAGFTGQALAQGAVAEQQVDHMALMKTAVKYATIADAYNAYCSESPSTMASNYLDQFYLREDVTIVQKDELAGVMETEVNKFLANLQQNQPSCEDVEFMLGRLDAMRKLKDVSYLLNGVDPATIPDDDASELRDLLLSHDKKQSEPALQVPQ